METPGTFTFLDQMVKNRKSRSKQEYFSHKSRIKNQTRRFLKNWKRLKKSRFQKNRTFASIQANMCTEIPLQ